MPRRDSINCVNRESSLKEKAHASFGRLSDEQRGQDKAQIRAISGSCRMVVTGGFKRMCFLRVKMVVAVPKVRRQRFQYASVAILYVPRAAH